GRWWMSSLPSRLPSAMTAGLPLSRRGVRLARSLTPQRLAHSIRPRPSAGACGSSQGKRQTLPLWWCLFSAAAPSVDEAIGPSGGLSYGGRERAEVRSRGLGDVREPYLRQPARQAVPAG